MTVREAKEIGKDWVAKEGARLTGFSGAFFAGSINWKSEDAEFPSGSDLDLFIIVDRDDVASLRTSKFTYRNVVLEPAYFPIAEFRDPEAVLSDYRVACHLTVPSIIADPRSVLAEVRPVVLAEYSRRKWIRKRCDAVREYVAGYISLGESASSPYYQWAGWACFCIFAPRILALADLRDPTAKKSLLVSAEVLAKYGELHIQDLFFTVLGTGEITVEEASYCLNESVAVLNRAIPFYRTPCEGDNFVSATARDLLVRGVQEMFDAGHHREVINFLDMIFIISLIVIENDAPEDVRREAQDMFWRFMSHHRVYSEDDHHARIRLARSSLDELMAATERILHANPRARD